MIMVPMRVRNILALRRLLVRRSRQFIMTTFVGMLGGRVALQVFGSMRVVVRFGGLLGFGGFLGGRGGC